VTELAPGGVTKMSPKEYTNNNKNISKRTLGESSTYSRKKNGTAENKGITKNRVSKDFREGIFRNRIFEIYDNLYDLKTVKELVEEGTQRACKDLLVNRAKDFERLGVEVDIKSMAKKISKEFPYGEFPENEEKARNFYTATICNMVADSISDLVFENH
jgi:hypothetical protein